ncbi:DNA transposase THAP9 [Araneus ventricosus]|uniref:DNA transposase THAP9 n=1 Tax=Araneus ventricosus TaxID=182803 RepID=A0A4Y2QAN8_ARAVE|nr:DNA transposase THAP9 [Araneus ventricosus]
MVEKALELIHDRGIDVVSLTFDGPSTTTATAKELGCTFEAEAIKSHFPHPVTQKDIVVIYDPSHMVRLVRNCLASKGSIFDDQNRMVRWDFIAKLHELQKKEGLHLANKLQTRHIQWQREKMKVNLATQVFSKSVADALLYLNNSLQHPDFEGCEATVDFVKLFDSLFDIFNSKNLLAKGFKSPLSKNNNENIFKFLCDAESYVRGLKISRNGPSILNSNRRTGFLGFHVCIKSLKLLITLIS